MRPKERLSNVSHPVMVGLVLLFTGVHLYADEGLG